MMPRQLRQAFVFLLVTGIVCPLLADGVDDSRAAAVYIHVKDTKMGGSGSGFVVARTAANLYVVTNEHVVTLQTGRTGFDIQGVFYSGMSRERTEKMELVAVDPVHDLALLRTASFEGAPSPIMLQQAIEPEVGQRLAVIGFPFGSLLDLRDKNPLVTETRAVVAQPFHNHFGALPAIELTGSANPGNSGGPVVDSKGRLAGVLVAGYKVGKAIRIIPAEFVRDLWGGTYLYCGSELSWGYGLTAHFDIVYTVADPFAATSAARLVVLPAGDLPETADRETFHRLAAEHLTVPLPTESLPPGMPRKIPLTLVAPATGQGDFVVGVQTTRKDGSVCLGAPVPLRIEGAVEPRPLTLDTQEIDGILAGVGRVAETSGAATAYAYSVGKAGATPVRELASSTGLRILSPSFEAKTLCLPCWLNQGSEAVVVDSDGWLVKVALPSFKRIDAQELAWPRPTGIGGMAEGVELASRNALVHSRSRLLLLSRSGEQTGCVHVIDPETLEVIDFFSLPNAVALSAVPESERVLVRYANGELAVLSPDDRQVSTLCRPRTAQALRVAGGSPSVPTLPVDMVADAALVSPGDRMLVLADHKALALTLADSSILPVTSDTPVWEGCAALHCQPGSTIAVLTPVETANPARWVDLQSSRTGELPARSGTRAQFDGVGNALVEMRDGKPWPVLSRQDLAEGKVQSYTWPVPGMTANEAVLAAHPRSQCYWVDLKGTVFWAEVASEPWVARADPAATPAPVTTTKRDHEPQDLGQNLDLRIRELALPATDVVGVCWTSNGKGLLAAWGDGTIRLIDPWSLAVVSEQSLAKRCIALSGSQCGPVATLSTDEGTQFVILDDASLSVTRTIDAPPCTVLATGARSTLALGTVRDAGIIYVDLASGRMTKPLAETALPGPGGTLDLRVLDSVLVAPDGGRLYLTANGRLVSWARGGGKVDAVLGGDAASGGVHRVADVRLSDDGIFADLTIEDQNGSRRHEVRDAADLRTVYRAIEGDPLIVFDCGARRLLYTGQTPRDTYPFASGDQDSLLLGWVLYPVSFDWGPRVIAHPGGNHLLTFGERIHALHYSSEASQ